MKPGHLLSSLYLAPLALAAPLVQTSVLIAGASTRTVVLRTGPPRASLPLRGGSPAHAAGHTAPETPEEEDAPPPPPPSASLDSERPLTTAELMALSGPPAVVGPASGERPPEEKPMAAAAAAAKGSVSVGALVAPGARPDALAGVLDVDSVRPYLVPGYYVSSQRADVLVVGLILAFVLVVLAAETWGLVVGVVSRVFGCGKGRRCAEDKEPGPVAGLTTRDRGPDGDGEDPVPFAGYRLGGGLRSPRLPDTLDEKAAALI